jgi:hypothetical protein
VEEPVLESRHLEVLGALLVVHWGNKPSQSSLVLVECRTAHHQRVVEAAEVGKLEVLEVRRRRLVEVRGVEAENLEGDLAVRHCWVVHRLW